MLGEPSRVALISTSFGSNEALGIDISGVQLGSISIKSCVCVFSKLHNVQADSLNELQETLY